MNIDTIISNIDTLVQTSSSLSGKLNDELLQLGTSDIAALKSKMDDVNQKLSEAKTNAESVKAQLDSIENLVKNGPGGM